MTPQQYQQETHKKLTERDYKRYDYPHNRESYSIVQKKNLEDRFVVVRFWDQEALNQSTENQYDIKIYKEKYAYTINFYAYNFNPSYLFEILDRYERKRIPTN